MKRRASMGAAIAAAGAAAAIYLFSQHAQAKGERAQPPGSGRTVELTE